jgi:pimeloyl-ACP methyl ester carboxylesterase
MITQPLFEHHIDLDGYRSRALEIEGDGPGLVLIHGYGDSADTWRPLLDVLARHGQRAIAIDLPGFGQASHLGPGAVLPQLDAFAAAVIERAAEEAGGGVVLAGNSLGGVVSLRAAEREDLPILGVVPIAPAGFDMPRWFELIDRDPVIRSVLALPIPIPRPAMTLAVGEVFKRLAFSKASLADRRVVAAFASHHGDREAVRRLLATGRTMLPELVKDTFAHDRVTCPVLCIWGTKDRMVPSSGTVILQEGLPNARVELLEGCGHCPQLEETGRVAELLLEFISELALI